MNLKLEVFLLNISETNTNNQSIVNQITRNLTNHQLDLFINEVKSNPKFSDFQKSNVDKLARNQ